MAHLRIKKINKFQSKSPLLFVGFPGIGQISKLITGLIIENETPLKIYEIYSNLFPSAVQINEDDTVKKFHFEVYSVPLKNSEFDNLLLFTSNFELRDEQSLNILSRELLDFFEKKLKIKTIISIAGIGLERPEENPELFITGNNLELIKSVKKKLKLKNEVHNFVSRISGMNGLMLLSKIPSVCFLVESYNHPLYVGLKEAQIVVKALKKTFKISISTKKLEKGIKSIEKEVNKLKRESETKNQSYIG